MPQAQVLSDRAALETSLQGKSFLFYGTLESPWLTRHQESLPFTFDGQTLRIGGREFRGEALRWICAVRNPVDRDRRAVLYCAARTRDLININALVHGPTEWLVADGERVLAAGHYQATLTPQRMNADIEFLLQTLLEVHPATLQGLPERVKLAAGQARDQAQAPLEHDRFLYLVQKVLVSLSDAHTSMNLSFGGPMLDLPIRWLHSDGLVVSEDTYLLRRGDRILSIGGRGEADLASELAKLVAAENQWWVRSRGEWLLRDVTVLRAMGMTQSDSVHIEIEREGVKQSLELSPAAANRPSAPPPAWARWTIEDSGPLGIFTLDRCENNKFYQQTVRDFFAAVHERGVRTIAIDLRKNSGGNSSVLNEFMRYLDVPEYTVFGISTRVSKQSMERRGGLALPGYWPVPPLKLKNPRVDDPPPFNGRCFALISNRTFSSGMDFASTLRANGVAELVGEPTGNAPSCYGDILGFTLPESGLAFTVSYKKFIRPDPQRDPADTLPPDHLVPLTRQYLLEGRDPVLDFVRDAVTAKARK